MPGRSARPATRRIAIVRLTSLGDVIHTLPVAAAIRAHDPSIRVIWLAEEREQILLVDNPVVDEVITVPLRRWRASLKGAAAGRTMRELNALRRRLRDLEADAAIDVQGWPHKTSPFAWLTRAPVRVGFAWSHARHPLATWFTTTRVTPPADATHIVDQNLTLLGPLGITLPRTPEFPLPAFSAAQSRADAWLRPHRAAGRRIIALLPATRGAAKHWPVASYRELAARILADPSAIVLVLGGPGEEARLRGVRQGLPDERVLVEAPGPIPDLVGLLRRVDLAVGNDTGPIHVAAAAGVPTLGLFGPTRGARNGPYGPRCGFVQSPTARMADITVEDVVAGIERLGRPATTSAS